MNAMKYVNICLSFVVKKSPYLCIFFEILQHIDNFACISTLFIAREKRECYNLSGAKF